MVDETNTAAEEATAAGSDTTGTDTAQFNDQHAAWLKYQAKIEVVREVLARRGAIPEQEAKMLSECVNTAFDGISFK